MHAVRCHVMMLSSRCDACFRARDAIQDYDCYYFILALAKPVTCLLILPVVLWAE